MSIILFEKIFLGGLKKETEKIGFNLIKEIKKKGGLKVLGGMMAKIYELLNIEIDFEVKDGLNGSEKW